MAKAKGPNEVEAVLIYDDDDERMLAEIKQIMAAYVPVVSDARTPPEEVQFISSDSNSYFEKMSEQLPKNALDIVKLIKAYRLLKSNATGSSLSPQAEVDVADDSRADVSVGQQQESEIKASEGQGERSFFPATLVIKRISSYFLLKDYSAPSAAQFVLLLIPKRSREHLIGDLEEEYRSVVLPQYGRFWAGVWYWGQTLWAIGPYLWVGLKRVFGWAAIIKLIGG